MKPPTPAMIKALRHVEWLGTQSLFAPRPLECSDATLGALLRRGLVKWVWRRLTDGVFVLPELTDAGRRVLAEQGQQ